MKIVIIGGVAGGATAAARLRRLDESAEIVMLERSGYVSYANCGLPYYVGGVITDREALTLQTPQRFRERFNIDARVHHEATGIDTAAKTVAVRNLRDGTDYAEAYDALILSPGARPVRPPLPGIEDARVFALRTVEDAFALQGFITEKKPRRAVVVGGGFIGLEMAENLAHQGIGVTIVERLNQVMMPLDYDMACLVHGHLREKGVTLRLAASVTGFAADEGGIETRLEDGTSVPADMVLLAIGVTPDTALARDAGLALGVRGAIVVDEHMRASAPDVYAVGDAVTVVNRVTQSEVLLPLAGPANKQGRIAADNIRGIPSRYRGVDGTSVLKVFDLTVAATGVGEKIATAESLGCGSVITSPASHATYYPGHTQMTMKVLFNPEKGRILGAQIVGRDGVDKRIDVLATAIRAGMTAADLAELDLAYAPPYSSAKDPVNMAGYMIGNVLAGRVRQFGWREVETVRTDPGVTLLDARTAQEYAHGHIGGAVSIPLDSLRDRLDELDRGKPVYAYCHSGMRSYVACRILMQHGFECYNLSGGYQFYRAVAGASEG